MYSTCKVDVDIFNSHHKELRGTTPHGIPAGLIIKETGHSHGRNLHSETRPAPLFEAVLEFEAGMLQPPPRRKKPMLATTTYSD